jgi:hypothetical protein
MGSIPLFTSVPPRISRINLDGYEIGETYQINCVESWIEAGFSPYSINSSQEKLPEFALDLMQIRTVARDAKEATGKNLVFISDFLQEITKVVGGGPFALINADILINKSADISNMVASLKKGSCMIEHRFDFEDFQTTVNAKPYMYGYDFFAFNVEDVRYLPSEKFVFGIPWCDYYLPLLAKFAGLKRQRCDLPVAYHLSHNVQWSGSFWEDYGSMFLDCVKMTNGGDLQESYLTRLRAEVESKRLYAGLNRRTIRNALERFAGIPEPRGDVLKRLSLMTIESINDW